MKKAYTKALCIESENKFFEPGTIYPRIKGANNNCERVISADDEGEVYVLECFEYERVHEDKGKTIDTIETPHAPRVVFIEL